MGCNVMVDQGLCKGCGICISICPTSALEMSRGVGERGYHFPLLTGQCKGCRLCEELCPDFAIVVECGDEE